MKQIMDIVVGVLTIGVGALMIIFPKAVWKIRMTPLFILRNEKEREPNTLELIVEGLVGGLFIVLGTMLCVLQP